MLYLFLKKKKLLYFVLIILILIVVTMKQTFSIINIIKTKIHN